MVCTGYRVLRNCCGAVMVELAIVIPVLVLLLVTLVEFGRLFRDNIWLSQTAYHALVAGAENAESDAMLVMPHLADRLYRVQNRNFKDALISGGGCNSGSGFRCVYDHVTGTLRIEVETTLLPIIREMLATSRVALTAPVLIGDPIPPSDLNVFKNAEDGVFMNCDSTGPNPSPGDECCGVDHVVGVAGMQAPDGGSGGNACP